MFLELPFVFLVSLVCDNIVPWLVDTDSGSDCSFDNLLCSENSNSGSELEVDHNSTKKWCVNYH
jgi:hypothetical protein